MIRILTPGVFHDVVLLASVAVRDTVIGQTLRIDDNRYCASFDAVRVILKKLEEARFSRSLDLVGHCDGTSLDIGGWTIGDKDGIGVKGMKELAPLLRKQRITAVRLLGCVTAAVPGLLAKVDDAINAGYASKIVVWGTAIPLNEEHFDAAGLRCHNSGRLEKAPSSTIGPRPLFDRVVANRLTRRKPQAERQWTVRRISYEQARAYIMKMPLATARLYTAVDFLLRPDVEYVFCMHQNMDCQCKIDDMASLCSVLSGKGVLLRGESRDALLVFSRRRTSMPISTEADPIQS